jgi:hypothetical protein
MARRYISLRLMALRIGVGAAKAARRFELRAAKAAPTLFHSTLAH